MATGVSIRIDGLDAALVRLGEISARAANPRGLWQQVGAHLEKQSAQRFATEREPSGNPWPKSIRALAWSGQTLSKTGLLKGSLTYNAGGIVAGDTGVVMGTNVPYAAIHQFGGTIRRKAHKRVLNFKVHARTGKILKGFRKAGQSNFAMRVDVGEHDITIPARPFIGLEADDPAEILTIAETWLSGGSDGAA